MPLRSWFAPFGSDASTRRRQSASVRPADLPVVPAPQIECCEDRLLLSAVNAFAQKTGAESPFTGLQDEYYSIYYQQRATTTKFTFADINGDGLQDMLATLEYYYISLDTPVGVSSTNFYLNTGTASSPVFTKQTGAANPFQSLNLDEVDQTGDYDTPINHGFTLVDFDGNGTADLIAGTINGTVRYFKNVGTTTAPNYVEQTGSNNPFNGVTNLSAIGSTTVGDVDGDGLLDVLVSGGNQMMAYLKNTGTANLPAFTLQTGANSPFTGLDIGTASYNRFATLIDFNVDGKVDLVVGKTDGTFAYLKNTGTTGNPVFTLVNDSTNPIIGITVNRYGVMSFADLTGDGVPDMALAGNQGIFFLKGSFTTPPVLNNAGNPSLSTGEDELNPNGTLISDLIASMSPSGGITDPDAGAVKGIAIIGADTTKGIWQFTLIGGSTWTNIGSVSDTSARLLAADSLTRIRFIPNSPTNFNGTIASALTFRAWDQTQGGNGLVLSISISGQLIPSVSTVIETASLVVIPANDAPYFYPYTYNAPITPIPEDIAPLQNAGMLVKDLFTAMENDGRGITDADAGALQGLAIVGANQTNGTWQYSLNNGSTWADFGATAPSSALLLAADNSTRFRFLPKADFNGQVGFTFYAWDQTTGTNGGRTAITQTGGTTAFSVATRNAFINVTPVAEGAAVAVFRNGTFYLDANANHQWDGINGGDKVFGFGAATDLPVTGDWNGDGITDVGIFRSGTFYLDANGNGIWDGPAYGDAVFGFSAVNDIPVTGDWNGDGKTEVGVFRNGYFYLDLNGNRRWDGTQGDVAFGFSAVNDIPITGDWNGDGITDVGAVRNGRFYLDENGNRRWDGPSVDVTFGFGSTTDLPVTGDWNRDGKTDVGIFRLGKFYLDNNGNRLWDGTEGGDSVFAFGSVSDKPASGLWTASVSSIAPSATPPEAALASTIAVKKRSTDSVA